MSDSKLTVGGLLRTQDEIAMRLGIALLGFTANPRVFNTPEARRLAMASVLGITPERLDKALDDLARAGLIDFLALP